MSIGLGLYLEKPKCAGGSKAYVTYPCSRRTAELFCGGAGEVADGRRHVFYGAGHVRFALSHDRARDGEVHHRDGEELEGDGPLDPAGFRVV